MDTIAILRAKVDFHKTWMMVGLIGILSTIIGAVSVIGRDQTAFYSLSFLAFLFFIGFLAGFFFYLDRHIQLMDTLFRQR